MKNIHLLVSTLSFFLETYGNSSLTLLLPYYFTQLNVPLVMIGYFSFIGLIGKLIGSIMLGILTDKYGYKKILLGVLFLDIFFFAGYAFFRNIYIIMTIKFVSGIFATIVPAVDMITKESPPESRTKHYSFPLSMTIFGPASSSLILFIMSKFVTDVYTQVIIQCSIPISLCLITITLLYKHKPSNNASGSISRSTSTDSFTSHLHTHMGIFICVNLLSLSYGIITTSAMVYFPILLVEYFRLSTFQLSGIVLLQTACFIVLFTIFQKYTLPKTKLHLIYIFTTVFAFIFVSTQSSILYFIPRESIGGVISAVIVGAFMNICVTMMDALNRTTITLCTPSLDFQAKAQSTMMFTVTLGGIFSSTLYSYVYEWEPLYPLFFIMIPASFFLIPISYYISKQDVFAVKTNIQDEELSKAPPRSSSPLISDQVVEV